MRASLILLTFASGILPPWGQTPWAHVVYGLLTMGGFALAAGFWRKRSEEKESEQAREQKSPQPRELKQAYGQRERAYAILAAFNAESESTALLNAVLRELSTVLTVDKASALIYDEERDAYLFKASLGWDIDDLAEIRMTAEEAEVRYLRPAEEAAADIFLARDLEDLPGSERLGVPASLLVMRMRSDGRIDGYLIFESTSDRDAFDASDAARLENLREHVRSAFVKARLLERLQRSLDHLKQTQAKLVQQEKMASLGQLTAGIAHEIKNPLNFVNNFSLVSRELVGDAHALLGSLDVEGPEITELRAILDDLKTNAKKIEEHGRRADGIVRSMLEHSRGTRGEKREVDLNDFVDDYVNLAYHGMRAQVADFDVAIERDYDERAGQVELVPQELGRVLVNLFVNAFDAVYERKSAYSTGSNTGRGPHSDDEGDSRGGSRGSRGVRRRESAGRSETNYNPKVRIATRRNERCVEIRVEDNGPGIPEEAREKIFEPFYTTKPSGKGTGLGLSLSYEIVTSGHGGNLRVSDVEDGGAAFIVELPAKK